MAEQNAFRQLFPTDEAKLKAFRLGLAEREKQITVKGMKPEDDIYKSDQLLQAAASYVHAARLLEAHLVPASFLGTPPVSWPWAAKNWHPASAPRMREKAMGLTMAALQAQTSEYALASTPEAGESDG